MLPCLVGMFLISDILKSRPSLQNAFNKWSLTALSLSLLYTASAETLLIFLSVSLLAYIGCRMGQHATMRVKTCFLAVLIPLLLLPLFYYKYAHFLATDVLKQDWDTFRDLIIPIGISFYTFQIIAFCIDTLRRNQAVPAFIDYMNFCSFFPQIVAGPIERKDSLLPQMEQLKWKFKSSAAAHGLPYIILGLFFKLVLADNIANSMQIGYNGTNAFQIWTNNLAFTFRIYFDFAGYGITAYGLAKSLGINITMNFMSPYTCCNVTDFWRNWHISLTQWFRDYIYFAMGGSRTRFWMLNIIIMFLISGIWHGAGWNFIIWGGLAGVTMVIHRYFRKANLALPAFIGWLLTFGIMVFIWMFFYETDMSLIVQHLHSLVQWDNYNVKEYITLLEKDVITSSLLICFIPFAFGIIALEHISRKKYNNPYQIFLSPFACFIMLVLMCILHPEQQPQFIYFAF